MNYDLLPEMDQAKYSILSTATTLEKMFLLAYQLKFKRRRTYADYAIVLDKSERQVRRDIKTLEKFFEIDYDVYGRPFILTEANEDELTVTLTKDEIQVLINHTKSSKSKLLVGIRKKLERELSKAAGIMELDLKEANISERLDKIRDCINSKSQLKVHLYKNLKGNRSSDIILEPISISHLKYLTAFDVAAEKTKNYVISRMSGLEIMDEPMSFREKHQRLTPDIFGINTGMEYDVKLQLSTLAYTLLKEDFPQAKNNIIITDSSQYPYELITRLNGLEGIGRFVLGLPGEINIIKPNALKVYVANKIEEFEN